MDQKITCLGILLALLLSGCSVPREVDPAEPAETVSETAATAAETVQPEDPASYCQFFSVGDTCQADLDGDGREETICLAVRESDGYWEGTLTINETTAALYLEEPTDVYCLVDICGDGSVQLIGVEDYGPSDDYVVNLYRYQGETGEIIWLDEISGLFSEPFFNGIPATCTGDGNIHTYDRLDVLQTWYALVTWNYVDGGLTMDKPEVYEAYDGLDGVGIDVTTLCDMVAFSDRSTGSKTQIIPAGNKLRLLGTDNVEWVEFEAEESGEALWFRLINGYFIQSDLAGGKLLPESVLENLCEYD
jgi:hypothetical protein